MSCMDPEQEYTRLKDVIQFNILQSLKNVHTATPGIIETFDKTTRTARIQIALNLVQTDRRCLKKAPLVNVPVIEPFTQNVGILLPIKPGDPCWVMFSERGLQSWKRDKTKTHDPSPPEQYHAQADAVAIVGFGPSGISAPTQDGVSIQNRQASVIINVREDGNVDIHVQDGKRVNIGGTNGKRLLTEDFMSVFNNHRHSVPGGGNTGTPSQQLRTDDFTEKTRAE